MSKSGPWSRHRLHPKSMWIISHRPFHERLKKNQHFNSKMELVRETLNWTYGHCTLRINELHSSHVHCHCEIVADLRSLKIKLDLHAFGKLCSRIFNLILKAATIAAASGCAPGLGLRTHFIFHLSTTYVTTHQTSCIKHHVSNIIYIKHHLCRWLFIAGRPK